MMQYLVTTFKDSIGHVHPHVTAAKPNQTFTVVEAESKEEAEEKVERMNRITDKDKAAIGKLMKLQRILSEEGQ